MTIVKPVMGATLGLQATALMGRAAGMLPKFKRKKIIPAKPKKLVRGFTDIIVGTALLKPTANLVSGL